MTDCRQLRFNKHINAWHITGHNLVESLWPMICHVFMCLLNRSCLWSVMYFCACWILVACDPNTWPFTTNKDSSSRQKHDHLQATTIPLAHKYMTDHRQQRFNKHTNTWPITGINYSTSTQIHDRSVACDRSCICVLVESLWPVSGHVFVC
jgi:hypothetical protein